jgi:hypothetical protein
MVVEYINMYMVYMAFEVCRYVLVVYHVGIYNTVWSVYTRKCKYRCIANGRRNQ